MQSEDYKIEIKFWGVRGSIATPSVHNIRYGGNTSCVQVIPKNSEKVLVFDCGSGVVNLGNELIKKSQFVRGDIFVTHTHWDHVQGIPFFKPFYKAGNQLNLHMYSQDEKSCREIVKMVMAPVFFPVDINAFQADIDYITQESDSKTIDDIQISALKTEHPGNTVMYKCVIGNKKIVYCPDNELPLAGEKRILAMQDFVMDADVLIHDSQENRASYQNKVGWGHSPWEVVVEFAERCRVKHLFLTHHDPESSDELLDERSKELDRYKPAFKTLRFAQEGSSFYL